MKSIFPKCLTILFFSIFINHSVQGQEVLWYGDPNKSVGQNFRRFDKGNFPQDYCSSQGNTDSSVGTVNDSKYGKVWRIRKPKGQKRGEFARTTGSVNSYTPKDGDLVYYGWRWKITSTPDINSGIAVWQWKTDAGNQNNTQNYPLNMGYGNGKLTLSAWGPCYPSWNSCGGSISDRKTTLWSKSIPENTWVSFVVGIKMSRNDEVGYVELWYHGVKQTLSNSGVKKYSADLSPDKKRAYHKTFDGTVTYPKWGSYNANACNFDTTTYYDEMRIAKTPTAATPSGTTGGNTPNNIPTIKFQEPAGDIVLSEGYEKLYVLADAQDPDNDTISLKLYIDGKEIREEKSAAYEWGHVSNNSDFTNETTNLPVGNHEFKVVVTDSRGATSSDTFNLEVIPSLSIGSFDTKPLAIYPNPSTGLFYLKETAQWDVYNLLGKKIKSGNSNTINLISFTKGYYMILTKDRAFASIIIK